MIDFDSKSLIWYDALKEIPQSYVFTLLYLKGAWSEDNKLYRCITYDFGNIAILGFILKV